MALEASVMQWYALFAGLSPIVVGGFAGFLRAGFGYLKARFKHGEAFAFGKFLKTIVLTTILGAMLGYFMVRPDPVYVGAVALSGGVMIDSIVYMLIGRGSKPKQQST